MRLVLRTGATHFNLLVACQKCGREVPGRAMLHPGDLDHPSQALICKECVGSSASIQRRPLQSPAPERANAASPAKGAEPKRAPAGAPKLTPPEPQTAELVDPLRAEQAELKHAAGGRTEQIVDQAVAQLNERVDALQSEIRTALERSGAVVDQVALGHDGLRAAQAELSRQMAQVTQRLELNPPIPSGHLEVLEARVQQLEARPDAEPVTPPTLESDLVQELAGRLDLLEDRLAGAGQADDQRLASLERRIEESIEQLTERAQLQATLDAEAARTTSEAVALGQRVDRLDDQVAGMAGADAERLEAVERRLDEMMSELAKTLASQRKELQAGLRDGLADVMAAVPAPAAHDQAGLQGLATQVEQDRDEISELHDLHAALDAGLGALRSELAEVRTTVSRVAGGQSELDDRLETFVRVSLVPESEQGRGRKAGRKTTESTIVTLSAAVQDLLREQRQLKDQIASLQQSADAAAASAARASTQASAFGPLRSDVRALQDELAGQEDAVESLRKNVERLQRPPALVAPTKPASARRAPAPKPAPVKAAPAKKAAPAAKRTPRAKKV